jgi:hypothetical protein
VEGVKGLSARRWWMRVVAAGTWQQDHDASNPAAETREKGMWRKERLSMNTTEDALLMTGTLAGGIAAGIRW